MRTRGGAAGSKREPMRGAAFEAPTDPKEIIDVTVRVCHAKGSKSLAGTVAELAALPPHARRHLSREEYTAAHGADHGDLEKVMAYASEHGLSAQSPSVAGRSVHLVGTAEAMTEAFGVDLKHYQVGEGLTYRGNADHVHVPPACPASSKPSSASTPVPTPALTSACGRPRRGPQPFNPPQLAKLYNFPTDVDGTGQVLGILEMGSPKGSGYTLAELQKYFLTELKLAEKRDGRCRLGRRHPQPTRDQPRRPAVRRR